VVATRARIVLWMAEGRRRKDVAELVGMSLPTVDRWVDRYADNGLAGLEGGSHAAPREQVPAAVRARVLALTRATPAGGDRVVALVEPTVGRVSQTSRGRVGVLALRGETVAGQRSAAAPAGHVQTVQGPCRCRKPRPGSSGGVLVFVEDAAESVVSPDVEVVESVRLGERA
jgi:hypothetical protein